MRIGHTLLAVVAVSLAATQMCGCLRKRPAAKPDARRVIRVVGSVGAHAGRRKHWEAWKAQFEADSPAWSMQLVDVSETEAQAHYTAQAAQDDLPEVVQLFGLAGRLADADYVQPLDASFYEQFGLPKPAAYKGKLYGTGGAYHICGIAVNRTLWKVAGLPVTVPADWKQFVADLEQVQRHLKAEGLDAHGYRALGWGGGDWSARLPLELALCADLYGRDRPEDQPSWTRCHDAREVSFASDPAAGKIVGNMVSLIRRFAAEAGRDAEGYRREQEQFFLGHRAAWFTGSWIGGEVQARGTQFGVEFWPMPSMVGRTPVYVTLSRVPGGWSLSRNATGDRAAAGKKVLAALYDPTVYQAYLDAENSLGAASKLYVKSPTAVDLSAREFYARVCAYQDVYGVTSGYHLPGGDALPKGFAEALGDTMVGILTDACAGRPSDVPAILRRLDEQWDDCRTGKDRRD